MYSSRHMINKDHTKWILPTGQKTTGVLTTGQKLEGTGQSVRKVLVNRPDTKERKKGPTKEIPASAGKLGNEVIFLFKDINPSYEQLYKRKPQHEAAERLISLHGFERLKNVVRFVSSRRVDQY